MTKALPSSVSAFSQHRPIRLGVWGLGRGLHIVGLARLLNFEVVAGCDHNPHFLEQFRRAIPEGRFTSREEEFLQWDFDAVLVATYCPAHADHSIAALRAGKHVLSEVTAFHTVAEGVRLVEAVAESGKVYQMAENYPYWPSNRYLAELWRKGYFGDLQYAEYSYVHDCLHYTYVYIDGTPIQPGYAVHNWRSWLPWHYYCTHSLGPVMVITGARPVEVVSLPGSRRIAGHILDSPDGLKGVAPSLIRFHQGGLMRNLMGTTTLDNDIQRLYGTEASSEIRDGKLLLRPGGRGHSWSLEAVPPTDSLGLLAAGSGHGGGDFWTLYHFAREIFEGVPGPFGIGPAADATLVGIQAFRSCRSGGQPQEVPNLLEAKERDRWRDDHFAPARPDPLTIAFPEMADRSPVGAFTTTMKQLLMAADHWQSFAKAALIFDTLKEPETVLVLADRVLENLSLILESSRQARALVGRAPESNGARALRETLGRLEAEFLDHPDPLQELLRRRESLTQNLPVWAPGEGEPVPKWPQLHMRRVGFDLLPELRLPEGYRLRSGRGEEDCVNWCRIIGESFGEPRTPENYRDAILKYDGYADDRLFFIEDPEGVACATAGAFRKGDEGYVHYVGVLPSHLGHKLGFHVSLAVLHSLRQQGRSTVRLTTDDFRLPAIKTYLRLGFRPMMVHRSHPWRWAQVLPQLGWAT